MSTFCTLALALLGLGTAEAATPADSATELDGFIELTAERTAQNRTPTSRPSSSSASRPSASRPSPSASRPSPSASRPSPSSSRPGPSSRPSPSYRPSSAPVRAPSSRPSAPSPAYRPSAPPTQRNAPVAPARPSPSRPAGTAPRTSSRPGGAPPPHAAPRTGAPRTSPNARPPQPGSRPTSARPASRPPASRPGVANARPGPRVHGRPSTYRRPATYAGASRPSRYYTTRRYHVHSYSGVFVYGPRPVYHSTYYVDGGRPGQPVQVAQKHMPKRTIDRDNSLAIGLKAGTYFGAYDGANAFGDIGVGLNARYRPTEAFGIEGAVQKHFDDERSHTLASASAELFAFPWSRVSPYVLGGATWTNRTVSDTIWRNNELQTISTNAPFIGLHGGAGLEIAIGQKAAIDLEARYIGYVNRNLADPTLPGAVTTSAGLMWHF